MAFYKNDNGFLISSVDRVINDNFELWVDQKDSYNYPVEGWYWFDSEIEARNTLECYSPVPFSSWVVNKNTAQYEPPVAYPTDGKNYGWDESTVSWVEITE